MAKTLKMVRALQTVILGVDGKSIKVKEGDELPMPEDAAKMHADAGYVKITNKKVPKPEPKPEPKPAADNLSQAEEIAAAEEAEDKAEDKAQEGGLSTKTLKGK